MVWSPVEAVNITIGAMIGLVLSFVTAYAYEYLVSRRKEREKRNAFSQLESYNKAFDYQHWNIINGRIADEPINSFMSIRYRENNLFDLDWHTLAVDGKIADYGSGLVIFDDFIRGELLFFELGRYNFDYRNFIYRPYIEHKGEYYTAFFINAKDQGTKYVMMRRRNWPH